MSDDPSPAGRFWLLTAGLPAGPFTPDEIRARVAAGGVPADVPTCPFGGSVWTPLAAVPGLAASPPPVTAGPPGEPVPLGLAELDTATPGDVFVPADAADRTPNGVENRHLADVRYYAFLTCVLLSVPTGATRVFGTPKAGFEDVVTLWTVAALTLPLTAAVGLVAGWLFVLTRRPEWRPGTDRDRATLAGVFAGVVLGSMLLGAWLGAVEIPEPVAAAQAAVPERVQGFAVRAILQQAARDRRVAVVALTVGAVASLGVYFTLYGPVLFGSSVAVGVFLGYVWGYKPVEVYDERAAGGPTPEAAAAGRLRRRAVGAVVGGAAVVGFVYHWGGEAALWRAGLAATAAGLAAAAWAGHLRDRKAHPALRPRPGLAALLAVGAASAGYWAYESHGAVRYECRVERSGHLEFGGRWVRGAGPDRVYFRNTSVMPLTNVRLTATATERRFPFLGGASWAETLTASRVEPGEEVSWPVQVTVGQARFAYELDTDQGR